ncbi:MAG: cell wall-binding repeat-containing protein, partial [Firmicutes bacterium]|nr:cell wall-binding repeat-containing protein [Bacillota bacterium]
MSKEMMQSSKRKPGIVFFLALIGITALLMLLAAQPAEAETNRIRLAGKNRYETSFAIAENLYKTHGKYANMTVASGANYPDALSSCYLTYEKDTPLLLVDKSVETQVLQRIKKYTKPGGTVYLIGGTGSVSAAFEQRVKAAGFKPVRLAGTDRYKTNLAILKAVGTNGKELLVASGMNYPDSLSASAVPKPLLLVGEKLTEEQKAFLRSSGITKFYILGGFGTIPITVQSELRACCGCPFERLGGENRYETSFKIAKKFFHNPPIMTLACGTNFPDGLSGGPLAMNKQAPLVLVNDLNYLFALRCGLDFRSETVYTFG